MSTAAIGRHRGPVLALVLVMGLCALAPPAHSSAAQTVAAQPNGKLLVGLVHGETPAIARLKRNGELDRSFGERGFAAVGYTALGLDHNATMTGIVVRPSGKIDVAAERAQYKSVAAYVIQLKKNGDRDLHYAIPKVGGSGASLALSSDGTLDQRRRGDRRVFGGRGRALRGQAVRHTR